MSTPQQRYAPTQRGRKALQLFVLSESLFVLVDLVFGLSYSTDVATTIASNLIGFAITLALAWGISRGLRWVWYTAVVTWVLGSILVLVDPEGSGLGQYPQPLLIVEYVLLNFLSVALLFVPDVKPPKRRKHEGTSDRKT